jgi:hypothetical protein
MIDVHVNYIAVFVATGAAWLFGALWYHGFVARWRDALGKTKEQLPDGRQPFGVMVLSFAAEFVMAAVLAHLVAALGPVTIVAGVVTAGACWLGFILPTIIVTNGYTRSRFALIAVASWHWLGVLLVMGAVIGAFG